MAGKRLSFKNLTGRKKNARSAVRLARRSLKRVSHSHAPHAGPGSTASAAKSGPRKTHFGQLKALALVPLRFAALCAGRLARLFKTGKSARAALIAGAVLILAAIIAVVVITGQAPVAAAQSTDAYMSAAYPRVLQDIPSPDTGKYVYEQSPTPVAVTSPDPSFTPVITTAPDPSPTAAPKPTAVPKPAPDLNGLVEYYVVEADKYYGGYSSNHYDYTEDELYMLAQVITREAGGESYEGQLAVGNVIINRALCGYKNWGSTIESVVTAPNQFSYKPGTKAKPSCMKAAGEVLKYERWVVPQSAYFFKVDKTPGDNWGRYKYCMKIGNHCFYTHKINSRSTKDGVPPALYKRVYKWPQYGCKPAKRVSRIQHMLSSLGYKVGQDGYFGKSTKDALVDFQKHRKLKADGVAGPATLKALIKAYGIDKYFLKYGI